MSEVSKSASRSTKAPAKTFRKPAPRTFTSSASKLKAKPAPVVKAASAFSSAPQETPKKKKLVVYFERIKVILLRTNKTKLSMIALAVMFVAASGVAAYSYNLLQQSQHQVKKLQNTKETAKLEAQKTIEAVAKVIVLPQNETPTIATVTDSNKLRNQAFFAKASNGDKVLIYTKSKKAILFNPAQNKVVEVAPINLGNNKNAEVAGTSTAVVSPTQSPSPTTAVRNQPTATERPVQTTTAPQQ